MHVNAKKMAVAGLLAAFSAVMLVMSSVIETNSLFFICAASFCVGITIREWGVSFGFAFLLASTLINVLVAPNKFYCITFAVMGMYLLLSEYLQKRVKRTGTLWIGKYLIFNFIYIPALLFFQDLLFVRKVTGITLIVFLLAGQIALVVYDRVYVYFQSVIWGKLRLRLLK